MIRRLLVLVPWALLCAAVSTMSGCSTPTVVKDRVKPAAVAVPTRPVRADQIPPIVQPLPARPRKEAAVPDLLLAKICELYGYALAVDPLVMLAAGLPPRPVPDFPECRDP